MWRKTLLDDDDIEASYGETMFEEPAVREVSADASVEKTAEALSLYLKAISRVPLLTKREEQVLAMRIRRGDKASKEQMITANLRLVVSIARRYQGMGLPLADLIGEGNLGLIKAVERYRYEKGFRFSTYASKWIRQAITKALATDSRTVRLPANVIDMMRRARVAEQRLTQSISRVPDDGEICGEMGISQSRFAQIANAASTVSLDSPCSADGDIMLHEVLSDGTCRLPDEVAFDRIDSGRLGDLLQNLSERERVILSYRFGLDDGSLRSLAETGKAVGITRERIRQIEKRAIEKMRRLMKKRRMERALMQRV